MQKHLTMRRLLYFLLLISTVISCKEQTANKAQMYSDCSKEDSGRGIYFWKTKFSLNDYELRFLKDHDISRLYVKFFDVALDNHSSDDTLSIVPIATTRFESEFPDDIEIVPTVYITYEALAHLKGKDIKDIESYTQRILTRIGAMISYHEIKNVKEVQFDCDWTSSTSYVYDSICRYAMMSLHQKGQLFSITLRLHQMKLSKYYFPSADRGVLMLYNTGSFKNPNATNSILTHQDAEPYIRKHQVPFPVDYAYPTYSWNLLFRDNEFKCIVRDINLTDSLLFQKSDYNKYTVLKDVALNELSLKKGDVIRHEDSEFKEIERVKSDLSRRHDMKNSRQLIYHLDSANLSKFSDDEIKYMLLAY